jgi:hypothetical protein
MASFPILNDTASEMSFRHGKKRCKHSFMPNRKYLILMDSGNVWTVGSNKLRRKDIHSPAWRSSYK